MPVFSSCSMTPTTISSSMPCVSTFVCPDAPPGDGGGVSAARPALFGRWSSKRSVVVRGGDVSEASEFECVRFTFLAACESLVEGGERGAREAPGMWMPMDGRDRLFRRVLYGIVSQMCSRNSLVEGQTATRVKGIMYRGWQEGCSQNVVAGEMPGPTIGSGMQQRCSLYPNTLPLDVCKVAHDASACTVARDDLLN